MSQKLSRRSFLKTAGAVAVAAVAMSTLTACGGGGSSTPDSKPTPSTPATPTTLGGIEIQKIYNSRVRWTNENKIPYRWFISLTVTVKNTNDKDIPLRDFGIKAKLDSIDRTPNYVEYKVGDKVWDYADTSTVVKAGNSMTFEVEYEVSEAFYNEWKDGKHTFEATLIYSGKKVTYSSKTGKLGNVENA